MKSKIASILSAVLLLAACRQTQNQQTVKMEVRAYNAMIEDVRVAGNRRIPTETIHSRIETKAGEPFNQLLINRDETRLRLSGDFDDVRVTVEKGPNGGRIVIFDVREKRP